MVPDFTTTNAEVQGFYPKSGYMFPIFSGETAKPSGHLKTAKKIPVQRINVIISQTTKEIPVYLMHKSPYMYYSTTFKRKKHRWTQATKKISDRNSSHLPGLPILCTPVKAPPNRASSTPATLRPARPETVTDSLGS